MAFIIAGCVLMALAAPFALCCLALKKLNHDLQQLYEDY